MAKECHSISAFVHLSNLQHKVGGKASDEKYLYPLPSKINTEESSNLSPTDILNHVLDTNPEKQPIYTDFKSLYSNAYLFSKSLSEHILTEQVLKNKEEGASQFPIAILRACPVGPGVQEPLIGWVSTK